MYALDAASVHHSPHHGAHYPHPHYPHHDPHGLDGQQLLQGRKRDSLFLSWLRLCHPPMVGPWADLDI